MGSGAPHSRIALVVHCLQAVCRRAVCKPGSTLHKEGDRHGEVSSLSANTMRDVRKDGASHTCSAGTRQVQHFYVRTLNVETTYISCRGG